MPTFRTHATPNPNSLKVTTDAGAFLDGGLASFNTPAEAEGHPLGAPLFAIGGVANVFILPQFLTITKDPGASWDTIWPAAERILAAHFTEG